MHETINVGNSADRPRLTEFLVVAEHEQLDVGLRMWVGAIEVGLVGTSSGRVVFAEIPGVEGDEALRLLASLPNARVVPEHWTARASNVESPWRTLLVEHKHATGAARAQRLAPAREALRSWAGAERSSESLDSAQPIDRALQIGLELLDWAAIRAYLGNNHDRARWLLERRTLLGPDDLIVRENLEVMRLRSLDEESCSSGGHE